MLHPRFLNSKLALVVSECQLLAAFRISVRTRVPVTYGGTMRIVLLLSSAAGPGLMHVLYFAVEGTVGSSRRLSIA